MIFFLKSPKNMTAGEIRQIVKKESQELIDQAEFLEAKIRELMADLRNTNAKIVALQDFINSLN